MGTQGEVSPPAKPIGPSYRPEQEKPKCTVSLEVPHENVHTLTQSAQLLSLLTYVLEDRNVM